MDIRDIIKGQDLKTALGDLTAYVINTFGSPVYVSESSSMRLFSYPKYDICFRVDILTYNLSMSIQSYDSRISNYISSVGIVYDFNEFKEVVEILTEGDCAYKEVGFKGTPGEDILHH